MNKFNFKKINQNGVAIIWTLMFSMIFLVIVTTLVLLVVKGLRITATVDQSNRAYLAAEAGMEKAMYEVKQRFRSDIFWCSNLNFNQNLEGTNLVYRATVACTTVPVKKITIESTGIDREVVNRKLKSEINFVDSSGKIEKFDATPSGWSSSGYYDFPALSGASNSPLIIQQFDITRTANFNSGEWFKIGLGNGTPGSNYYYLNFARTASNQLTLSIVNLPSSTSSSQNFPVNMTLDEPYRIKVEYARQGTFYTVIRATVLRRDPEAWLNGIESFICINSPVNYYVVYSGISGSVFPFVPSKVRVQGSSSSVISSSLGNGFVLLNGKLRVDNMVFWGKE